VATAKPKTSAPKIRSSVPVSSGPSHAEAVFVTVAVKQLHNADGMALPAYQTDQAAGLDLAAAISGGDGVTIKPGARVLVPTGLVLELPLGFEGQVRPRSGLALRHGLTVLNAPGTIDSDYRGEVSVLLINLGSEPVMIHRGDRIAQLVIAPVAHARLVTTSITTDTPRGNGGYGSTGMTEANAAGAVHSSATGVLKKSAAAKVSRAKKK
jgi:dUTP pyrophosphatase